MAATIASGAAGGAGSRAAAGAGGPGAAEVHAGALVVDTHVDTTQRLLDEGYDLASPRGGAGQLDLEGLRRGNVGAVFFVLWWDPSMAGTDPHERALALLDAVRAQVARHGDRLALAGSADEILAARRAGRTAVLLGLEGAEPLLGDVAAIGRWHERGVRYVGLTWNQHTPFADAGAPASPRHGGLSALGRAAIAEMNRLGMIVDVSHLSDASAAQAVAASRAPVLATHSSARALADHRRNLPDDLVRAVAARGGVVHVNFHSAFLDAAFGARLHAAERAHEGDLAALERSLAGEDPRTRRWRMHEARMRLALALPRPPIDVLVDHVAHLARVAGVDHVGIGSDFDGGVVPPAGIDSPADLPKLTAALLARGFSPEDVRKILGESFLRAFRAVERVARDGR